MPLLKNFGKTIVVRLRSFTTQHLLIKIISAHPADTTTHPARSFARPYPLHSRCSVLMRSRMPSSVHLSHQYASRFERIHKLESPFACPVPPPPLAGLHGSPWWHRSSPGIISHPPHNLWRRPPGSSNNSDVDLGPVTAPQPYHAF